MGSDKKIKVYHIASGDLWAGAEVQVYNMVAALCRSEQVEVSAIILNEGRLARQLIEIGVETKVIDESNNSFQQILQQASQWLTGRETDIIHSHRFKENILAAKILKQKQTKHLVQTVHGLGEPFKGIRQVKVAITGLLNSYYSKKYFSRIIAVSEDIGQTIRPRFGNDRVTVVYNAVDLPESDLASERTTIRNEFGLANSNFLIGTAGRLTAVKAYDQFLLAARKIADQEPQARFMIAGDGPLKDELIALTKKLNLTDRVIFPGFRNDMPAILAAFDLFVMTSLHEGIPVVLLEAMALGRPAITTAVGGMVEVIETGKSGQLVEVNRPEAMADACLELINNRDLREKLGQAAIARVKTSFTSSKQKSRLLEIYQQLIDHPELSA